MCESIAALQVTLSVTIAWLFSSSIWAHGVSMVKKEVSRFDFNLPECINYDRKGVQGSHVCNIVEEPGYGGLNVSLVS